MARRKNKNNKGRRRNGNITIPISIVAGFLPGVSNVWGHRKDDPDSMVAGMAAAASRIYLGYASTNRYGYNDTIGFHPYLLNYGTLPIIAGGIVHWLANKVGINRAISRARIPFIRV